MTGAGRIRRSIRSPPSARMQIGVVDWMFAVPLFLFPDAFLRALGWAGVDPVAARGGAAALVGIGTQSLLSRDTRLDRPGLP